MITKKKIACKMEEEQAQDSVSPCNHSPVSYWTVFFFAIPSSCATPDGENSTVAGQCTETERIPVKDARNKSW